MGIVNVQAAPSEFVPSVIVVTWSTEAPSTSRVDFALDGVVVRTLADSALTTEHELRMQGLKAGREYGVAVSSASGEHVETAEGSTVAVEAAPAWVPAITLSNVDAARHEGGYLLMSIGKQGESGAVLLDREGDVVWWASPGPNVLSTASRIRLDGVSVLVGSQLPELGGDEGSILDVALDGSTWRTLPAPGFHHAFAEVDGGAVAYVAADIRDFEGALVMGDTIEIVGADESVTQLFNAWDHYLPAARCSHYEAVDYAGGAIDWMHANSLAWDPERNQLNLMARNWDSLIEVDRTTGEPGLQLGGATSDFTFTHTENGPFDHPHYSHLTDDGFAVLDNGAHRDPPASRAAEYTLDREAGTLDLTWEYWDPEGRYVAALGDVQRLPGGNHLVSWGAAGLVTEIAGQDVVWQLETEITGATGWIEYVPTLPGDRP